MKQEIKVPAMGESINEATIGTIFKQSGGSVEADEEILEIETDKANQPLYAPQAGTLQLQVKEGDVVKIGQVIGSIEAAQASASKKEPQPKQEPAQKQESHEDQLKSAKQIKEPAQKQQTPEDQLKSAKQNKESAQKQQSPEDQLKSAKQIIEDARFTRDAFLADLKEEKKSSSQETDQQRHEPTIAIQAPEIGQKAETRKKMSKIRRLIANRMVEAQHTAAMLTTFNEADMNEVIQLREKYKESFQKMHGVKLGYMSFFVKACVDALKEFPDVNASIEGEDLVYKNYYDIGIAVGTERGVIVPVVKGAEKLTFAEIEKALEKFAEKARQGSISADDLQGGTFTITNGGVYGSMLSTPILNPPQSAILGMHKIIKRPVAIDDQIQIRPMMYLALTYDHRVIDGQQAVQFLVRIKKHPGRSFTPIPGSLKREGKQCQQKNMMSLSLDRVLEAMLLPQDQPKVALRLCASKKTKHLEGLASMWDVSHRKLFFNPRNFSTSSKKSCRSWHWCSKSQSQFQRDDETQRDCRQKFDRWCCGDFQKKPGRFNPRCREVSWSPSD